MTDTRLKDLANWVDTHGLERIHTLSGFNGKRTIKQYLSQQRPPSWAVYHKIRRALASEA
ncbi:hypothetical protein NVP1022O_81 [Vibrio phage 1.022.O._10N.286.45.A10]|nr:hypothetical protein NVP1022O_81 [Vibrio phage 1.022.O._10N.286.45.A10]